MSTIPINNAAVREQLEDREAVIERLADIAGRVSGFASQVATNTAALTEWTTKRNDLGDKVRRGIVRDYPVADGLLPAQIWDAYIERDETQTIVAFHTNEEAVAARAAAYGGGGE